MFSPGSAAITCHYSTSDCTVPRWSGPAVNRSRATFQIIQSGTSRLTIASTESVDEGNYFCSCGEDTTNTPSHLDVLCKSDSWYDCVLLADVCHPTVNPSFEGVQTNWTFQRGERAVVVCDAFPGDPEQTISWRFRGRSVPHADFPHLREDKHRKTLIFESIGMSDAGTYTCLFNTFGEHSVEITVNVIEEETGTEIVLPDSINVTFGRPLDLDCVTRPPAAQTRWIIRKNMITIHTRILHLEPEALIGTSSYTCIATTSAGREIERTVYVRQTGIPFHLKGRREDSETAMEGDQIEFHAALKYPLDSTTNLSFRWRPIGGSAHRNFTSRLTYTISERSLRMMLSHVELLDKGRYAVTISNDHGNDTLMVTIHVTAMERTALELKFNISCELLKVKKLASPHNFKILCLFSCTK